jgi:hypothetical protein
MRISVRRTKKKCGFKKRTSSMKIIMKTTWRKKRMNGRMKMTQWRESRLMKKNINKKLWEYSDLRKANFQS